MAFPTIDFSFFLKEGDDHEDEKKKATYEVGKACLEFGFFQVINHGLPIDLMNRARDLSKTFFEYPIDEKLKFKPRSKIFPSGYGRMDSFVGCNEWLMVSQPELGFNVFSDNTPQLRETLEGFYQLCKNFGLIVEGMINDSLGLPVDLLKNYNDDRSTDALLVWYYPKTTEDKDNKLGRQEHQDMNCITILLQDEVEGLEFEIGGKWIPIFPVEGALLVNIGTIIQVLTNKRMMAARHRVLNNSKRSRQSFAYFYTMGSNKWIEPLPQFTTEVGEAPKYKGFPYKELLQARLNKEINPPDEAQDLTGVDRYEISSFISG